MHKKDCSCLTHDGPHWLWMDYLDRQRNLDLLERCVNDCLVNNSYDALLAHEAFVQAESRRLNEKLANMKAHNLSEVSYSWLGQTAIVNLTEREREILGRLPNREAKVA